MTEQREQTWAELEARAVRLLEHAKEVEPRDPVRRYGSLLRLWHFPAYGPQTTWTILTPGRKTPPGAGPLVREVTWDRPADDRRMAEAPGRGGDAGPSLRLREAALPEAGLRELLEHGSHLAVPVVGCSHPVGLDGEHFGLETYEVSPGVRVQWWRDGPAAWRHFTDWAAGVRAFLLRHLDQAGRT
jgi:hypothetical protein